MILFLVLTLSGCETTSQTQQIKIPDFSIVKPTRPELVEIPTDTSAALKAMAVNMSKMDGYIRQLENFVLFQANYIKLIKGIHFIE
jgi:PBP1b-binding outer membrane lipoprotein LpoB